MNWLKTSFLITAIFLAAFYFKHDHYQNIGNSGDPDFFKLIKWKFTREKPAWPKLPENKPLSQEPNITEEVYGDEMVVTYINHSTMLIQMNGENILTDPIWSEYAGPFGEFGVKRSIYPGMDIENLPHIDFVLISHSHYDHLDVPTLDKLINKFHPIIITGLGVTRYIDYCKERKANCYELEWWQEVKILESELTFYFVPAYHWSSRYFFDKDTSLWGGFVISNSKDNVYFAGDTGFSDGMIFRQMKEKFGNFRLSLLPIGAYKPGWFFSSMHISPLEAVKISKILDSNYTIPIHYNTFELSDENYNDPLTDLKNALQTEEVPGYKFNILPVGGVWHVPKS